MIIPKIKKVSALDQKILIVTFDNGKIKKYDITRLLSNDMFAPLKKQAFFKNVKVDTGGYAVYWNAMIDISEHELWTNGTTQ